MSSRVLHRTVRHRHEGGDAMKKYRFRLETALRVRKVEEDFAVAALADAHRSLAEADARLDRRLDRYRDTPLPQGPMSVEQLLRMRSHVDGVAASVVFAGAVRLGAEATVDVRRTEWSEAAARVSALERLDERRRAEHALEAQRQELIEVDDMVVARAGRRVS
jgi:flagellar export protein FliJ